MEKVICDCEIQPCLLHEEDSSDLALLKNLCEFFRRCDHAEMLEIYGKELGAHFWNKFNNLHRDWAWWLCSLDFANLEKLITHIK